MAELPDEESGAGTQNKGGSVFGADRRILQNGNNALGGLQIMQDTVTVPACLKKCFQHVLKGSFRSVFLMARRLLHSSAGVDVQNVTASHKRF